MKRIFQSKVRARIISALLLLSLTGICLAGCGSRQTKSASAVMEQLLSGLGTVPSYRLYAKEDGDPGSGKGRSFSKEDFSYLYTGSYASGQEIGGLDDYCVLLPVRPAVFEIHILRAVSASGVPSLVKLLAGRAALLKRHAASVREADEGAWETQADPLILVYGQTVILIATDRNEEIRSLLDGIFRRSASVPQE